MYINRIHNYLLLVMGLMLTACNFFRSDESIIKEIVNKWDQAHQSKDPGLFNALYNDSLLYYGMKKDKLWCVGNKIDLFKKNEEFFQDLITDIRIEETSQDEYKCSFVKRVTTNKKTNSYPSYLIVSRIGGDWKITSESDLITDANIKERSISRMATKPAEVDKDLVSMPISKYDIKGDFNGDGKLDYGWLLAPNYNESSMDCNGDCICIIKFSDPGIPPIRIETCINGKPDNLGDLNNDGTDEIGMIPAWITSCWRSYHVWSFQKNGWAQPLEDKISIYMCNEGDVILNPITKDPEIEGNVIIEYDEYTGNGNMRKTQSIPFK